MDRAMKRSWKRWRKGRNVGGNSGDWGKARNDVGNEGDPGILLLRFPSIKLDRVRALKEIIMKLERGKGWRDVMRKIKNRERERERNLNGKFKKYLRIRKLIRKKEFKIRT